MKKILVLYGSYGGGHLSAAKSIQKYFETNHKKDIEIKIIDCIEYINKYINKVSTEAYKELAKKAPWIWKKVYNNSKDGALAYMSNTSNKLMSYKLMSLLQEENPDLIISTHPFATQMCTHLKETKKINYRLATILTDFHIHPQWLVSYEHNNFFFVANSQMKLDMVGLGVNDENIFVTGIPVGDKFSKRINKQAVYDEFGLSKDRKTILFFAGGEFGLGRNTTYMTLKAIIRLFKDTQVIAISGKNQKMKNKFEKLIETTDAFDRVKLLEFSNKIPELMHISDFVITKPGGLTVTESLVSNLPIIIINPIPGQEEENAEFLLKHECAIWIKKEDNIARALKNLYRNPDKFTIMSENTKKIAKPSSTQNICEILLENIPGVIDVVNVL
jgi:processive 1,2-diacylglycerol beta-glucosyltransferase